VDHRWVARVLLSLLCGIQGIATLVIDLNRTHATNPTWVRHARFHVVWQTLTMALLAVVEIALIWGGWVDAERGFYLAVTLAALSPAAFLLSFAGRGWFGGALSDPNGIPPLRVVVGGRTLLVDMNLGAVIAAVLSLAAFVAIYRW
jgi:hypothetical protein